MVYNCKIYKDVGGDRLNIDAGGVINIAGNSVTAAATKILPYGAQHAKIADPTGGTTVDAEARAAIAAIIDALEAFGISAAS